MPLVTFLLDFDFDFAFDVDLDFQFSLFDFCYNAFVFHHLSSSVAILGQGSRLDADAEAPGGALGEPATLADTAPTGDGMAVDVRGNVYLTTREGVEVYAPDGTQWGTIEVPEVPANCAFGGAERQTLYITARTGLYAVDTPLAVHLP